jgi:hypothetical protein
VDLDGIVEGDADAISLGDIDLYGPRLDAARQRVQSLQEQARPAAADLAAQLGAVARLVDAGTAGEGDLDDLEDALLEAEMELRVDAISQEIRIPLTLKKLLIEWRAAQDVAQAGIGAIGDAFLADAEVQGDPRFDVVFDTVKTLPDLLPSFGRSLDQTIDALLSDGAKTKAVMDASLEAVAECRARLAGAAVLGELEALARAQYGGDFRAYTPMAESLARIEQELRALVTA